MNEEELKEKIKIQYMKNSKLKTQINDIQVQIDEYKMEITQAKTIIDSMKN